MITNNELTRIFAWVSTIRDVVLLANPDRIRPRTLATRFPHPDTGLPLTEAELPVSNGLPVVLDISRGRIQNGSCVWPDSKCWIIWLVEIYPGHYLARSPGSAPVPTQYNDIGWEPVPDATPVTTIAGLRAKEKERRRYWNGWRASQTITTPGTRLKWQDLAGWLDSWQKLKSRAYGRVHYQHLRALSPAMIDREPDPQRLYMLVAEIGRLQISRSLVQSLVDVADKRLARLHHPTSRQYRLQRLSTAEPTPQEKIPATLF